MHRSRRPEYFAQAAFDCLAHGLLWVQLRFLRQVTDIQARHRHRFADDILVDAGHNFQQRGFAGTIQAEHADLGAGKEGQRNILKDLAFRWDDFAHAIHGVDVICHVVFICVKMWRR